MEVFPQTPMEVVESIRGKWGKGPPSSAGMREPVEVSGLHSRTFAFPRAPTIELHLAR